MTRFLAQELITEQALSAISFDKPHAEPPLPLICKMGICYCDYLLSTCPPSLQRQKEEIKRDSLIAWNY